MKSIPINELLTADQGNSRLFGLAACWRARGGSVLWVVSALVMLGIFRPGGIVAAVETALTAEARGGARGLSESELREIGMRVWKNECGGTVSGLTSWNKGEKFASLGIGHFIWYPAGSRGPFEESFPRLVQMLVKEQAKVPQWLAEARQCPWPTREAFEADAQSTRMRELRELLAETVGLQSRFLAERLQSWTATLASKVKPEEQAHAMKEYQLLASTSRGTFALIDYINFKGDGTNASERYKGQGWGLLQVLLETRAGNAAEAPELFGKAAAKVLRRRVENAPPERHEAQWLPGWTNRVHSY